MASVYFDNAATTAIDEDVKNAMIKAMDTFGNPSSIHGTGRKSKAIIESERRKIATIFSCAPSEIVFTSGGTEADNLAVLGVVEAGNVETIISSRLEHPAVLASIAKAQKLFQVEVMWVNHLPTGEIDILHLESLLSLSSHAMVSLMHVNNEIGTILDIVKVGQLCRVYSAVFHSDTVQSIGHFQFDLKNIPVDLITCSAHKINGPKGSGFLYVRKGVKIAMQMNGGKQEREYRGGTENILGVIGLGTAVELAYSRFDSVNGHLLDLKKYFIAQLRNKLPDLVFNGNSGNVEESVNTIVSVNFPLTSSNELVLFQFDLKGIMVSGGSACSSGGLKGSHVLEGLDIQGSSIRVSFGNQNTKSEVDYLINEMVSLNL